MSATPFLALGVGNNIDLARTAAQPLAHVLSSVLSHSNDGEHAIHKSLQAYQLAAKDLVNQVHGNIFQPAPDAPEDQFRLLLVDSSLGQQALHLESSLIRESHLSLGILVLIYDPEIMRARISQAKRPGVGLRCPHFLDPDHHRPLLTPSLRVARSRNLKGNKHSKQKDPHAKLQKF